MEQWRLLKRGRLWPPFYFVHPRPSRTPLFSSVPLSFLVSARSPPTSRLLLCLFLPRTCHKWVHTRHESGIFLFATVRRERLTSNGPHKLSYSFDFYPRLLTLAVYPRAMWRTLIFSEWMGGHLGWFIGAWGPRERKLQEETRAVCRVAVAHGKMLFRERYIIRKIMKLTIIVV